MNDIFIRTKKASSSLLSLTDGQRNDILLKLADAIEADIPAIIEANSRDLARMDKANPLYDRLLLNEKRLRDIASDMRNVAGLPSPLDRVLSETVRPNGLKLRKVTVPFGVIGIVYEARPNVTFDVFSLCFKSGNAVILKGGKDADESNRAAVSLIKKVLSDNGVNPDAVNILPATHEAVGELLGAVGYVDLVIPRGGRKLIDFVRQNSSVPCIETGAGVVDTYFDASADLEMGRKIITNAKTRRVSVCNALDCLIIHSSRLSDLPSLVSEMASRVTIYADERAYKALEGKYYLLEKTDENSFGTEYMDYMMSVRTVDSLDEALEHISLYGSGHSESIVTSDKTNAERFQKLVDAACVYVNAPTSFTDGGQFGLGAEIGISTQKLGARGPMGLEEITSYKWLIEGCGQTRP